MIDFEPLIESIAERVASKLEGRLGASGSMVRPRLLTVEQGAEYIGRTVPAVQHMVASGKLPTVRSDRRVFIDVQDLDRWIEENKQAGV